MLRATTILLLLCAAACGQGSQTISRQPGLIEIRLDTPIAEGKDVSISWEARDPLTLQYRVYEDGTVFVTYAVQKGRFIVQSELLDWDARKQVKTTWIVNVIDGTDPVDPDDDDKPEPNPPGPVPNDVSNVMGVGRIAYAEAAKMPKDEALRLGSVFFVCENDMHQGKLTPADANKKVSEAIATYSGNWTQFQSKLAAAMNKELNERGRTFSNFKNMYREVRLALQKVSE